VSEYAQELALLWCVLLNAAVFAAAYRFAIRRMTHDRVQAVLDAALLSYGVQYVSVCLPGILGALRAGTMTAAAVLLAAMLWAAGGVGRTAGNGKSVPPPTPQLPTEQKSAPWSSWVVVVAVLFALGDLATFVQLQSLLPVMSNDALTYHVPAAVQWLQTGRLGLFQTWFFNPANTYSPLAGSTFIAWLLAPLDMDALARFVEVPALLMVGLAVFQVCRQLRVELAIAGVIAAAVVLARPMFFASIMCKDDLFVAAFFLCALIAMTPPRAGEPFSAVRLGASLGLLAATKYTALLSVPMLLLVIDGPWRAGRRWRWWGAVIGLSVVLAGPWYWRNFWLTRNPVFPIDVSMLGFHVFRGLFTPARSQALHTLDGVWAVLTGGDYGLTPANAAIVALGWCVLWMRRTREGWREPLLRACLIGPLIGVVLFIARSPFPEVRFVFPSFALLFVCAAAGIDALPAPLPLRQAIAAGVCAIAWWTALANHETNLRFGAVGLLLVIVALPVLWLSRNWNARKRLGILGGIAAVLLVGYTFVNWTASVEAYRAATFIEGSGWDLSYPQYRPLWQFIAEHVPADARLAYTNMYLVYPLQGIALDRRVVYAPTRPGVQSIADLPWFGDRLPGERLVPAAVDATVAHADRSIWRRNLRESGTQYLVIGKIGALVAPPEAAFAATDSRSFRKLFENDAGIVYVIEWPAGE
jgi:hypothetical protein